MAKSACKRMMSAAEDDLGPRHSQDEEWQQSCSGEEEEEDNADTTSPTLSLGSKGPRLTPDPPPAPRVSNGRGRPPKKRPRPLDFDLTMVEEAPPKSPEGPPVPLKPRSRPQKFLVRWDKIHGLDPKASPEAVVLRPLDETKDPTVEDRWHRLYPPYLPLGTKITIRHGQTAAVASVLAWLEGAGPPIYQIQWEEGHGTETVALGAETEDRLEGEFGWKYLEKPALRIGDRVAVLYDTDYYEGVITAAIAAGVGRPSNSTREACERRRQQSAASSLSLAEHFDLSLPQPGPLCFSPPSPGASSQRHPLSQASSLTDLPWPPVPRRWGRPPGTSSDPPLSSPPSLLDSDLPMEHLTLRPGQRKLRHRLGELQRRREAGEVQREQRQRRRAEHRDQVTAMRMQMRWTPRLLPSTSASGKRKALGCGTEGVGGKLLDAEEEQEDPELGWQPRPAPMPQEQLAAACQVPNAMVVVAVRPEEYDVAQDILEKEFDLLPRMISGIVRKGNFDTRTVVVIWKGEAVGVATLKLHKLQAQAPPVLEIVLFAIRGDYHKQGLGSVLSATLYELGRRILCARVVLRAAPNAHGFWQRVGYADFSPSEKEREILLHNNVEFSRGCRFMERIYCAPEEEEPRCQLRTVLKVHRQTVSLVVDSLTGMVWEPDSG